MSYSTARPKSYSVIYGGSSQLNPAVVARNLRQLAHHLRGLLERDSYDRLMEVAIDVQSFRPLRGRLRSRQPPWEVLIDQQNPIRFTPSEIDPRLAPDIFCDIAGPVDDGWPLSKQRLVIRIWSVHKNLSFRSEWDCDRVSRLLSERAPPERVILRCHFDRASIYQEAPLFHLQIGGRPQEQEKELCWFPEEVDLPRLLYPPVDLVLASELVVANFFPSAFRKLQNTPQWVSLINDAESFLLREFYDRCYRTCNRAIKGTVLGSLWQRPLPKKFE